MGHRILGSRQPAVSLFISAALMMLATPALAQATSRLDASVVARNIAADHPSENTRADRNEHATDAAAVVVTNRPVDINQRIFHKNKLEFSVEGGMLPFNIPFPFDFLMGDGYNMTPLHYTLVPIMASVRWQTGNVGGRWMFRGNWEMSFTGFATPIPRGPETHYFGYAMGIRRNFVQPNWRATPFFEFRAGMGGEDAKEPKGVPFAQGQDFAFTLMMDSGVRYRITPRYGVWLGVQWMHISNLYMSEPRYLNYGINVYGPMIGFDMEIHGHRRVQ